MDKDILKKLNQREIDELKFEFIEELTREEKARKVIKGKLADEVRDIFIDMWEDFPDWEKISKMTGPEFSWEEYNEAHTDYFMDKLFEWKIKWSGRQYEAK